MWLEIMRFWGWLIFCGQENGNVFRGLPPIPNVSIGGKKLFIVVADYRTDFISIIVDVI